MRVREENCWRQSGPEEHYDANHRSERHSYLAPRRSVREAIYQCHDTQQDGEACVIDPARCDHRENAHQREDETQAPRSPQSAHKIARTDQERYTHAEDRRVHRTEVHVLDAEPVIGDAIKGKRGKDRHRTTQADHSQDPQCGERRCRE